MLLHPTETLTALTNLRDRRAGKKLFWSAGRGRSKRHGRQLPTNLGNTFLKCIPVKIWGASHSSSTLLDTFRFMIADGKGLESYVGQARSRLRATGQPVLRRNRCAQLLFSCGRNRPINRNMIFTPRHQSRFSQDLMFVYLQYAWNVPFYSHICDGRPIRRTLQGCQESKRWTHWCAGKIATCYAKSNIFLGMWCKTMHWRGCLQQTSCPVHPLAESFRPSPSSNQLPMAVQRLISIISTKKNCKVASWEL